MNKLIIVFLFLFPITGYAQLYINKNKTTVREKISRVFEGKDKISATLTETDSSLVMKVRGSDASETDYIYRFDKTGKCRSEKVVTRCDTCFETLYQQVLARKKYRWKKINLNQQVSKFSAGVFVEIQKTGDEYSYTIFRTDLNRKMYKFLMKNK